MAGSGRRRRKAAAAAAAGAAPAQVGALWRRQRHCIRACPPSWGQWWSTAGPAERPAVPPHAHREGFPRQLARSALVDDSPASPIRFATRGLGAAARARPRRRARLPARPNKPPRTRPAPTGRGGGAWSCMEAGWVAAALRRRQWSGARGTCSARELARARRPPPAASPHPGRLLHLLRAPCPATAGPRSVALRLPSARSSTMRCIAGPAPRQALLLLALLAAAGATLCSGRAAASEAGPLRQVRHPPRLPRQDCELPMESLITAAAPHSSGCLPCRCRRDGTGLALRPRGGCKR